jgi:hypothetical protein
MYILKHISHMLTQCELFTNGSYAYETVIFVQFLFLFLFKLQPVSKTLIISRATQLSYERAVHSTR